MKRVLLGFAAGLAAAIIVFSAGKGISLHGTDVDSKVSPQTVEATASPARVEMPSAAPRATASVVAVAHNERIQAEATIPSSTHTATLPAPTATPIASATPMPSQKATPAQTTTPVPITSTETSAIISAAVTIQPKTVATSNTAPVMSETKPSVQDEVQTTVSQIDQTGEMRALSDEYISEVMRGINDSRAKEGNPTVTLDSGFCELAAAHAKEMAEAGRMYHSKLRMIESVGKGTVGGMIAYSTGAYSAYHAPQIARDTDVTRVGVGGWIKDGDIYICIVAE